MTRRGVFATPLAGEGGRSARFSDFLTVSLAASGAIRFQPDPADRRVGQDWGVPCGLSYVDRGKERTATQVAQLVPAVAKAP